MIWKYKCMEERLFGASAHTGTVAALIRAHMSTARPAPELLTLVLELDIQGPARFLSHADLQRGLTRCCVRAQLNLRYTQGFNPHPRLSLPLPKPVGLASCGDVLCVRLNVQGEDVPDELDQAPMRCVLDAQLPRGIGLRALYVVPGKITLYPRGFTCSFSLGSSDAQGRVKAKIPELLARERLLIDRTNPKKPYKTKQIDIRPYISSIEMARQVLQVNCLIRDTGTVRIEEILMSLGLDRTELSGPVQRDHLTWQLQ